MSRKEGTAPDLTERQALESLVDPAASLRFDPKDLPNPDDVAEVNNGQTSRVSELIKKRVFGLGIVGAAGGAAVIVGSGHLPAIHRNIEVAHADGNPNYIPNEDEPNPDGPPIVPDDGDPNNDLPVTSPTADFHDVATSTPTPRPPTATPTETRVPPTSTPTEVPPTATPTKTKTPVPPTATPTGTRVPPTSTPTEVLPTPTSPAVPSPQEREAVVPPQPVLPEECPPGEGPLPPEFPVGGGILGEQNKQIKCEVVGLEQAVEEHDTKNDFEHIAIIEEIKPIEEGLGIDANRDGETCIDTNKDGKCGPEDFEAVGPALGVRPGEPSLAERIDKIWTAVKGGTHDVWDRVDTATSIVGAAAGLTAVGLLLRRRRNGTDGPQPPQPGAGDGPEGREESAEAEGQLDIQPPDGVQEALPAEAKAPVVALAVAAAGNGEAEHAEPAGQLSDEAVEMLAKLTESIEQIIAKIDEMSDATLRQVVRKLGEDNMDILRKVLVLLGNDEEEIDKMKEIVMLRRFASNYRELTDADQSRIITRRLELVNQARQDAGGQVAAQV